MERRTTVSQPFDLTYDLPSTGDLERLEILLAANAEIALAKKEQRTETARLEAAGMKQPLSRETVFACLGLLLGSLPPAALFIRILGEGDGLPVEQWWLYALLFFANLATAFAGYFSGKIVAKILRSLEDVSIGKTILLLPLIGMTWGAVSGAVGGAFLFIFGAIFGAAIGSVVGGLVLPLFAAAHKTLKRGDSMEFAQFLPVALGMTLTVCAFIFGYNN
jgi:hypothetical protein